MRLVKLKNLSLQIQGSLETESWYIASGIQGLLSFPNEGRRLTTVRFTARSKFAPIHLYKENVGNWFSQWIVEINSLKLTTYD